MAEVHNEEDHIQDLIQELISVDCIKQGTFTLKSGQISRYYYDMKKLVSYPSLVSKIGDALYSSITNSGIEFDFLCGIPLGGLPITCYISLKYNIPMIMLRPSSKSYGTCSRYEGEISPNMNRCLIIDDVITSGLSLRQSIDALKSQNVSINVVGAAVIVDRQQGYNSDNSGNVTVISLLSKTDVTRYRLKKIIESKKTRLCFAADNCYDLEVLLQVLDTVGESIAICKIHWDVIRCALFKSNMMTENEFKCELISLAVKHDFLLMEDRKFVDIGFIVSQQYAEFSNWIDLVTVSALVTESTIKGLSGVVIVSQMSNTSDTFNFNQRAEALATCCQDQVIGFVSQTPITSFPNMYVMTPGVKGVVSLSETEKKDNDDQSYRSAAEIINSISSDIIIVGRGIYEHDSISVICNIAKEYALLSANKDYVA